MAARGESTKYAIEARLGDVGSYSYELIGAANTVQDLLRVVRINEFDMYGKISRQWEYKDGVPFYLTAKRYLESYIESKARVAIFKLFGDDYETF